MGKVQKYALPYPREFSARGGTGGGDSNTALQAASNYISSFNSMQLGPAVSVSLATTPAAMPSRTGGAFRVSAFISGTASSDTETIVISTRLNAIIARSVVITAEDGGTWHAAMDYIIDNGGMGFPIGGVYNFDLIASIGMGTLTVGAVQANLTIQEVPLNPGP